MLLNSYQSPSGDLTIAYKIFVIDWKITLKYFEYDDLLIKIGLRLLEIGL